MIPRSILVVLLILKLAGAAPTPPGGFDHHMTIIADTYDLYWSVIETEIHFEVQVKTLGYVGFGISRTGGMGGSDIVTGWMKDDIAYFQDRHSYKNEEPIIDEEQNWSLLSANETDGFTTLRFKRLLVTCDENDVEITGETMRLIYAFHPDDPDDNSTTISYHGNHRRGTKSATLLLYDVKKNLDKIPDHTGTLDFANSNIKVPAKDTTYWCHAFKIPEEMENSHIVRIEPFFSPGNEGIVHHMTFYGCNNKKLNPAEVHGKNGECYDDFMGDVHNCTAFIFAWAIGGTATNMPDHVGYPIAEKFDMIRLETHFDNPSEKAGMIDASGLRIYYTHKLREYHAGNLALDANADKTLVIPPHFEGFVSQSHCSSECFAAAIPKDEDIKIFAVMLHGHEITTRVTVRHYRKGKELAPIANDHYYDYKYQDFRILPEEVSIKATDSLMVECEFNSMKRNNITMGGIGTREEMCLASLLYYPRRTLSRCTIAIVPSSGVQFIKPKIEKHEKEGIQYNKYYHFKITAPKEFVTENYLDVFYKIDWTNPEWRRRYQEHTLKGKNTVLQYCGDGWDNNILKNYYFNQVRTKSTYKAPPGKCTGSTMTSLSYLILLLLALFKIVM